MALSQYLHRFELLPGLLAWIKVGLGHRGFFGKEYKVTVPGFVNPIHLRAHTSDHMAFVDLILKDDLSESLSFTSGIVIDAGANIGLFAVNIASKCPDCKVVCIELDSENFGQLLKNTCHYENISSLNAGLWFESGSLKLKDPSAEHWARSAVSDDSSRGISIPAVPMHEIFSKFDIDVVRLLKIDIEGGEVELFSANLGWIDHVNEIYIELHDRFRQGCESALLNAIKNKVYKKSFVDEYTVIRFE